VHGHYRVCARTYSLFLQVHVGVVRRIAPIRALSTRTRCVIGLENLYLQTRSQRTTRQQSNVKLMDFNSKRPRKLDSRHQYKMKLITRRRLCHICIIEHVHQLSISLNTLRKASASGCLRCQLLCKSVEAFEHRWREQVQGIEDGVSIEITKQICGSSLVLTSVSWHTSCGRYEKLPVDITVDVG
jgi:hypothetical protein